jgi:hypothetical protein
MPVVQLLAALVTLVLFGWAYRIVLELEVAETAELLTMSASLPAPTRED